MICTSQKQSKQNQNYVEGLFGLDCFRKVCKEFEMTDLTAEFNFDNSWVKIFWEYSNMKVEKFIG